MKTARQMVICKWCSKEIEKADGILLGVDTIINEEQSEDEQSEDVDVYWCGCTDEEANSESRLEIIIRVL